MSREDAPTFLERHHRVGVLLTMLLLLALAVATGALLGSALVRLVDLVLGMLGSAS
ncbi:hypothetical protein [Nocardioides euryhalodurans]|uniref:hypothetical protein n=1 Tax=Nocardioides euryhalodurans TaxID=2518370 RepID=UPI00142254F3|nr:hypothetical protein [Nocardioides euryhalodurans]